MANESKIQSNDGTCIHQCCVYGKRHTSHHTHTAMPTPSWHGTCAGVCVCAPARYVRNHKYYLIFFSTHECLDASLRFQCRQNIPTNSYDLITSRWYFGFFFSFIFCSHFISFHYYCYYYFYVIFRCSFCFLPSTYYKYIFFFDCIFCVIVQIAVFRQDWHSERTATLLQWTHNMCTHIRRVNALNKIFVDNIGDDNDQIQ